MDPMDLARDAATRIFHRVGPYPRTDPTLVRKVTKELRDRERDLRELAAKRRSVICVSGWDGDSANAYGRRQEDHVFLYEHRAGTFGDLALDLDKLAHAVEREIEIWHSVLEAALDTLTGPLVLFRGQIRELVEQFADVRR